VGTNRISGTADRLGRCQRANVDQRNCCECLSYCAIL